MSSSLITLYCNSDPNSSKIKIVLEELGIPYEVRMIDITANEHKEEWFLKYNPNGRIPAVTDGEQCIFESGAIMLYLVEKYDKDRKLSYSLNDPEYGQELSWLMWQMGGLGPMQGQAHNFVAFAPVRSDYGIERYTQETMRLYSVLDKRLQKSPFVAGEKYTIADIASFTWARIEPQTVGIDLMEWPAVRKWHDTILRRDAVQKALDLPATEAADEQFAQMVAGLKLKMAARENTDKQ
ncbi:glutathione S-transferase [Bisporella sp. PMI_857]|nr:glutathione S-transferase [Bisporella sp. PMI_857]